MDTFDRSDSDVRANASGASSLPSESSLDQAAAPGHRVGIVRRLARHGWRIAALWLVGSAFAVYLISSLVEPTYEAASLLRIEPAQVQLFAAGDGPGAAQERSLQSYLQTQVEILKSDSVLEDAITTPTVVNLPRIKHSEDPTTELKNDLAVEIVGRGTYLIRVALASRIPSDAAVIVNAVVDTYMKQHMRYHHSSNSDLKKSLETELAKLEKEIDAKTAELKKLAAMGSLGDARRRPAAQAEENHADPAVQPAVRVVTAEQLARLTDRLIQVELDLIDAEARLEAARLARDQDRAKLSRPQAQPDKQATPRPTPDGPSLVSDEKLRELEAAVDEAKRRKIGYAQYIEKLTVESTNQKNDTVSYKLAEQDLLALKRMQGLIQEKLRQLDFEIGEDRLRVTLVDRAREPRIPSNNKRFEYMAVAPIGVFVIVLGLFWLSEIKAGRAASPAPSGPPA